MGHELSDENFGGYSDDIMFERRIKAISNITGRTCNFTKLHPWKFHQNGYIHNSKIYNLI